MVYVPLGTRPDPGPDGHLTIRDAIHGRETDLGQATYDPLTRRIARASAGGSFPLGDPDGSGGDAAGFPLRRAVLDPPAH